MQNFRVQTLEGLMPEHAYRPYVEVAPPGLLYGVIAGVNSVKVKGSIQYKGPKLDTIFYATIGNDVLGIMNDLWSKSSPITFAASSDWKTYPLEVTIPITVQAKLPWTPDWFDIEVSIGTGITGTYALGPKYLNVIEVLLAPAFQNFNIVSYEKV